MRLKARTIGLLLASATSLLAACGGEDKPDKPVATAGPGTGTMVVQGIVKHEGEPLAGAKVWLTLWPDDAGEVEEGGTVDTRDSKPITTDDRGHYALRLDPDTLTSAYFDGESLNFDITVFNKNKAASWGSTVWLVDRRVWRSEAALVGDSVLRMNFDLGKESITTVDSRGDREAAELPIGDAPSVLVPH
ncbi:hypothetical protein [Aeromicrobium sp. NPDC092404]|uniref:hypothetical protein n=1 Tax=Aeromicrobium sp. NPDC092404 TaxID=3154976 RepID=UPI00341448A6